jgi:hypothetical protein
MEPPIGWVPLRHAADLLGRTLHGLDWCSLEAVDAQRIALGLDYQINQVITSLAEQCEAGEIASGYRNTSGAVDILDCDVWRRPCWRDYFATGTVELDLPLQDDDRRPDPYGRTARCTREVFVKQQALSRFLRTKKKDTSASHPQPGSITAFLTSYCERVGARPTLRGFQQFAKDNKFGASRDAIRAAWRERYPEQRLGRPPKK